jgi:hypothetical protein
MWADWQRKLQLSSYPTSLPPILWSVLFWWFQSDWLCRSIRVRNMRARTDFGIMWGSCRLCQNLWSLLIIFFSGSNWLLFIDICFETFIEIGTQTCDLQRNFSKLQEGHKNNNCFDALHLLIGFRIVSSTFKSSKITRKPKLRKIRINSEHPKITSNLSFQYKCKNKWSFLLKTIYEWFLSSEKSGHGLSSNFHFLQTLCGNFSFLEYGCPNKCVYFLCDKVFMSCPVISLMQWPVV